MIWIAKPQAAPSILLVVLLEISIAAVAWQILVRRRRGAAVRAFANERNMRYQASDTFGLAERIVEHMPTPGAANLHARDLVYQQEGNNFFCMFTVSYTTGALGAKHRRQRVAGMHQIGNEYSWIVVPAEGKMLAQYEVVRKWLEKSTAMPSDITA